MTSDQKTETCAVPQKSSKRVTSISVGILTFLFCLPAIGLMVNVLRETDQVSETEQRMLAALPVWDGALWSYTAGLDDFLEDNFGLRMTLIRIAREIRDDLGEDPPQVAVGHDGWLFQNSHHYRDEFEGYGNWTQEQVDAWVVSLEHVHAALSERNIPFAAFVAIDKARAYPEMVPDDWTSGPRRFRTRLHETASGRSTGLVNVEPYLIAAKAAGVRTFYKRDTHWTPAGTYDLAMALMDRLDPKGERPRFEPGPMIMTRPDRLLDLDVMAGFQSSQEPVTPSLVMPPHGPDGVTSIQPSSDTSLQTGQFQTIRVDGTYDARPGRLVIVGDSFGDTLLGHFLPSFDDVIRIHHGAHHYDVTLDEILSYEPTAVLFATAERQAPRKETPFAHRQDNGAKN